MYSMYRAGSHRAKEISKHKTDFVGVQEVRWDSGGTEPAGTGFLVHKTNISAVKTLLVIRCRT
jgi:hypothetical protein